MGEKTGSKLYLNIKYLSSKNFILIIDIKKSKSHEFHVNVLARKLKTLLYIITL